MQRIPQNRMNSLECISWFASGKSFLKYYLPDKTQIFRYTNGTIQIPMKLTKEDLPRYVSDWGGWTYNSDDGIFVMNSHPKSFYIEGVAGYINRTLCNMIARELTRVSKRRFIYKPGQSDFIKHNIVFESSDATFGKINIIVKAFSEAIGWRLPDGTCVGLCSIWTDNFPDKEIYDKMKGTIIKPYKGNKPQIKILTDLLEGCTCWLEAVDKASKAYVRAKQEQLNGMARYFGIETSGTKQTTLMDLL